MGQRKGLTNRFQSDWLIAEVLLSLSAFLKIVFFSNFITNTPPAAEAERYQSEMKSEYHSKFLNALIKYRITIIGSVFGLLIFLSFFAALISSALSEQLNVSEYLWNVWILIMFVTSLILLIFYIVTGILKSKLNKVEKNLGKDEEQFIEYLDDGLSFGYRKLRIFIACLGSFVFSIILIFIVCLIFGLYDNLEGILKYYFCFGGIIWFVLSWPFFSKKLR